METKIGGIFRSVSGIMPIQYCVNQTLYQLHNLRVIANIPKNFQYFIQDGNSLKEHFFKVRLLRNTQ